MTRLLILFQRKSPLLSVIWQISSTANFCLVCLHILLIAVCNFRSVFKWDVSKLFQNNTETFKKVLRKKQIKTQHGWLCWAFLDYLIRHLTSVDWPQIKFNNSWKSMNRRAPANWVAKRDFLKQWTTANHIPSRWRWPWYGRVYKSRRIVLTIINLSILPCY